MPVDPRSQRLFVELNNGLLAEKGVVLAKDAMILDYGCGTGRHTYDYLDAGYTNVFGYDVKNYLNLRRPEDIERFRFDQNQTSGDQFPRMTTVPWPDNTFDFVYATSVFEHVIDQEVAYREVARVLKPGGHFLNNFPSKWRPKEPHMYVPFGGATQSKAWFRLWAALGIRNEFQQGLTAAETAERNHYYSLHGIMYPTGKEIEQMLGGIFSENVYLDYAFARHSPGKSRYLALPMAVLPPLRLLFRFAHTRVILSRK